MRRYGEVENPCPECHGAGWLGAGGWDPQPCTHCGQAGHAVRCDPNWQPEPMSLGLRVVMLVFGACLASMPVVFVIALVTK